MPRIIWRYQVPDPANDSRGHWRVGGPLIVSGRMIRGEVHGGFGLELRRHAGGRERRGRRGHGRGRRPRAQELGAEVHVLDLREPPVEVASYQATDLRDPIAVAAAVDNIGGRIDALFNCAGLPGGRFPDLDVMLVNFVGMRHLAELVVAHMEPGGAIASISSTAGWGWEENVDKWLPLVRTVGFEAGKAWCEAHPDEIAGGYGPSKQAMIIWTMLAAVGLASKGIRLNASAPDQPIRR